MKNFLLCLPAICFCLYVGTALFLQWKEKNRYMKNNISHKMINFLKMEATPVSRDDSDFNRTIADIKNKLASGKEVLTLINKKPVLISLKNNVVDIKHL